MLWWEFYFLHRIEGFTVTRRWRSIELLFLFFLCVFCFLLVQILYILGLHQLRLCVVEKGESRKVHVSKEKSIALKILKSSVELKIIMMLFIPSFKMVNSYPYKNDSCISFKHLLNFVVTVSCCRLGFYCSVCHQTKCRNNPTLCILDWKTNHSSSLSQSYFRY